MACWAAALGLVSWALEDLGKEEREKKVMARLKQDIHNMFFVFFFKPWPLTLCDFDFLLQRDQLQPEEFSHLLILLSLPVSKYRNNPVT